MLRVGSFDPSNLFWLNFPATYCAKFPFSCDYALDIILAGIYANLLEFKKQKGLRR